MTETITSLNYGQHILFGFISTSIHAQRGESLTVEELVDIAIIVEYLTDLELYNYIETDCPDIQIMMNPAEAFNIFCEWYEENKNYFEDFLAE